MFHNLIESSSHRQEIKRRGSFLLFTTATYAFLFAITGVVSIYAYDTHLEGANYEVVTMLPPGGISTPHSCCDSRGWTTKLGAHQIDHTSAREPDAQRESP